MKLLDILKKEDVNLIDKLTKETSAVFGIMTPQHMVEHLALVVQFSNGKKSTELAVPLEIADQLKQKLIYSDIQISQGVKSPLLPENDTIPFIYKNLEEAVKVLKEEISELEQYFKENPDAEPVNPVLGKLNYKEWQIFHNKHFTHHFKQFELI